MKTKEQIIEEVKAYGYDKENVIKLMLRYSYAEKYFRMMEKIKKEAVKTEIKLEREERTGEEAEDTMIEKMINETAEKMEDTTYSNLMLKNGVKAVRKEYKDKDGNTLLKIRISENEPIKENEEADIVLDQRFNDGTENSNDEGVVVLTERGYERMMEVIGNEEEELEEAMEEIICRKKTETWRKIAEILPENQTPKEGRNQISRSISDKMTIIIEKEGLYTKKEAEKLAESGDYETKARQMTEGILRKETEKTKRVITKQLTEKEKEILEKSTEFRLSERNTDPSWKMRLRYEDGLEEERTERLSEIQPLKKFNGLKQYELIKEMTAEEHYREQGIRMMTAEEMQELSEKTSEDKLYDRMKAEELPIYGDTEEDAVFIEKTDREIEIDGKKVTYRYVILSTEGYDNNPIETLSIARTDSTKKESEKTEEIIKGFLNNEDFKTIACYEDKGLRLYEQDRMNIPEKHTTLRAMLTLAERTDRERQRVREYLKELDNPKQNELLEKMYRTLDETNWSKNDPWDYEEFKNRIVTELKTRDLIEADIENFNIENGEISGVKRGIKPEKLINGRETRWLDKTFNHPLDEIIRILNKRTEENRERRSEKLAERHTKEGKHIYAMENDKGEFELTHDGLKLKKMKTGLYEIGESRTNGRKILTKIDKETIMEEGKENIIYIKENEINGNFKIEKNTINTYENVNESVVINSKYPENTGLVWENGQEMKIVINSSKLKETKNVKLNLIRISEGEDGKPKYCLTEKEEIGNLKNTKTEYKMETNHLIRYDLEKRREMNILGKKIDTQSIILTAKDSKITGYLNEKGKEVRLDEKQMEYYGMKFERVTDEERRKMTESNRRTIEEAGGDPEKFGYLTTEQKIKEEAKQIKEIKRQEQKEKRKQKRTTHCGI